MKHRSILSFLLFAAFFTCSLQGDEPVAENAKYDLTHLEKMTDDEIAQLAASEGIDVQDLRDMLTEKRSPDLATPLAPLSFEQKVAASIAEHPISDEELRPSVFLYSGSEARNVPEPKPVVIELGSKFNNFIQNHVRGKRLDKIMLVGYILYRQATWIYNAWLKERVAKTDNEAKKVDAFAKSWMGQVLSVTGMDSRLLEGADVLIRTAFCGTRLWMDMSDWLAIFQKPYLWMNNPDTFFQEFINSWRRTYYYFSRPLFYGAGLSLAPRVILGLMLPYLWASTFSTKSPGNPLGNPMFQSAVNQMTGVISLEFGQHADDVYQSKVSPKMQQKLFHYSGGIIRERLFTDVFMGLANYGYRKKILQYEDRTLTQYAKRHVGKYVIRHLYLHGMVEALKVFCRNGGLKGIGWLFDKCGWLLSKVGVFYENPVQSVGEKIKHSLLASGYLKQGQSLQEALVYPAVLFPGAFVRAVQRVVTNQMLPAIEKKDPQFLQHLNTMNGLSPYDLLQQFAYNPLITHMMYQSVEAVRRALPQQLWQKVLDLFVAEMVIDACLNRERLVCQYVTENIIGFVSKPVLHSLNKALLQD